MAKSIFLFKINDNFLSLKNQNNLDIILDTFLKSKESDYLKKQFNLMINKLDNNIKYNIINYFNDKDNFENINNTLILKNVYKNINEELKINDNFLIIKTEEENSIFLEYLSTYFVELIAIELENKKIYPLHLVKNPSLV